MRCPLATTTQYYRLYFPLWQNRRCLFLFYYYYSFMCFWKLTMRDKLTSCRWEIINGPKKFSRQFGEKEKKYITVVNFDRFENCVRCFKIVGGFDYMSFEYEGYFGWWLLRKYVVVLSYYYDFVLNSSNNFVFEFQKYAQSFYKLYGNFLYGNFLVFCSLVVRRNPAGK